MNTEILEAIRSGGQIDLSRLGNGGRRKRTVTINGETYERDQVDYHPLTKSPRAKRVLYPKDKVCSICGVVECHCDDSRSNKCSYHCGCDHCRGVTRVPSARRGMANILGVELELNYIPKLAPFRIAGQSTIQTDASVSPRGGEIITRAMTPREHMEFWKGKAKHLRWCYAHKHPEKPEQFDNYTFRSDHGMHIHMNWKALAPDSISTARDRAAVLCEWVSANMYDFVTHVAGREPNNYCDWRTPGYRGFLGHLDSCSNHSVAINANEKTIEFRIFRASTNWRTILGRIETVDAIRLFCMEHEFDADELRSKGPKEFYQWIGKKPKKWARVLRLADNEPC